MKKLLFIFLLGLSWTLKAEDYQLQVVGPFGTLNDIDTPISIPQDKAQALLNVDLTPGGRSVKKRKGFATAFSLSVASSPVHGIYNFFDASGNDVSLFFNDRRMSSSISGRSPTVLFSTGTFGATYQCVDALGSAYCSNTSRTSLIQTDGQIVTYLTNVNSTGTLLAVTPDRLVSSGFAEAPSRIDFSKSVDFTTWRVGGLPTDPLQFTITAPGSRITMICYAFNRIMWFKDNSFGYILDGPTQADWTIKTISPNVGTLDNSYIYWQGVLYFRGQDAHIYMYDGSNLSKMTRDISTTINNSQTRRSNSWTQSSQTDWEASSMAPAGYLSTTLVSGSIVLGTATAISSFVDTSSNDFTAGTLTTVDTTTIPDAIQLQSNYTTAVTTFNSYANTVSACCSLSSNLAAAYQAFIPTTTFKITNVELNVKRTGSPGNLILNIRNSNGSTIGNVVCSSTRTVNLVDTSTFSWIDVDFSTTGSLLNAGQKYWVGYEAFGNGSNLLSVNACDSGNGCVNSGNSFLYNGSLATIDFRYRSEGKTRFFSGSGNFVSQSLNVGFTTNTWLWSWSAFSASGTIPSNTTLTYETQTSALAGSGFNSLVSVSSGSSANSSVQQFIRYKASFSTTDTSTSPVFYGMSLAMTSRLRPNGTYYSIINNANNLTAWDAFSANSQNNGGMNNFFIRAATGAFTISSATPSWTAVGSGQIPSISTGIYFQIKDEISASSYTNNPKLDDFTQYWFEGSATDKAYAIYHKDALWWAVASGTSAVTTNNKILRYDLLNNGWLIYDIPMNGMMVRNQSLYFGGASTGTISKFGDVDNDNGQAINSYWKSKDFFCDSPFLDKNFVNMSVQATAISNSTMTVTYTIDASTSIAYTFPLLRAPANFTRYNRNLPIGSLGNTLNVQYGNNAADQPWEVIAGQFGFRSRSWNVSP